MALSDSAS